MASDGLTPIYGAEVAIGNLGYATTTDTNGFFEFDGVPLSHLHHPDKHGPCHGGQC